LFYFYQAWVCMGSPRTLKSKLTSRRAGAAVPPGTRMD
jgi:hypothetical protein